MPRPPGPKSLSPFEIARQFPGDPLGFVSRLQQGYGDFVTIRGPLYPTFFLLNAPDLIDQVLVKQADQFQKPTAFKQVARPFFGNGLFTSEGAFWRQQRRLIQPAFHHRHIETYGETMVHLTQAMLAGWKEGEQRDIDQVMHALTLQIMVSVIFQLDIRAESEEIGEALADLGAAFTEQATNPFKASLPEWLPLPFLLRKRRSIARLDQIIYRIIREHRLEMTERGDLLSVLMTAKDETTGEGMTDLQLHDEVFTLFIAGNETTALTLSWAWCLLAQHPEVEQKLDQELTSVLSGRLLRVTDLPQLPYTQAIIKEVLRLYPPAWISFRQAKVDLQLGGYDIKQGEMIWLTPYIVQRDPRYFDQPAQFWPERFLPDETGQPLERRIPRFAYYPFGGGPRICLGNGFAMLEASLILATMAQRYRFQLAANQPVQMKARATLGFESQVPMQPVSR